MMIARSRSAIARRNAPNACSGEPGLMSIGSDNLKRDLYHASRLAEVLHIQNTMTQPLDVRRSGRDALQEVQPFSVMNIVRSDCCRRFNTFGAAASSYYLKSLHGSRWDR